MQNLYFYSINTNRWLLRTKILISPDNQAFISVSYGVRCTRRVLESTAKNVSVTDNIHVKHQRFYILTSSNSLRLSDIHSLMCPVWWRPPTHLRGIKRSIRSALGPDLLLLLWCTRWGPMTCSWPCVTGQFLVQLILSLKKHLHLQPVSSGGEPWAALLLLWYVRVNSRSTCGCFLLFLRRQFPLIPLQTVWAVRNRTCSFIFDV